MRLRLALTITGGVSLGSFESGAVAALIGTLRPLSTGEDPQVRIDAIGGTSAGAITGLLAARTLLEGLDPIRVMEAGWVTLPSLATLRDPTRATPFTAQGLRDAAIDLLSVPDGPGSAGGEPSSQHQVVPVRLGLTLTNLRGLAYQLARPSGRPPLQALTHLDWTAVELRHGLDVEAFTSPAGGSIVDAALASAANALGFPPVLLDRHLDRDAYEANGIRNFPDSGTCWYTDGGTIDTEPLARTLDLAGLLDRDATADTRRVQVLIHPDPTSSPTGNQWADPDVDHRWLEVLGQVQKLQGTQTLYDDLRNLERTNTRLSWLDDLATTLGPVLGRLDAASADAVRQSLLDVAARIAADRDGFREQRADSGGDRVTVDFSGRRGVSSRVGTGAAAEAHVVGERPTRIALRHVADALDPDVVRGLSLDELFSTVTGTIAGLADKKPVDLEIISPKPIAAELGLPVDKVLAGAFLGHFGGFLDERLRASDFDLGYESALRWLAGGALDSVGLGASVVEPFLADARAAKQAHDRSHPVLHPSEPWRRWGGSTTGELGWRARLAAIQTAWGTARIAIRELSHRRPRE